MVGFEGQEGWRGGEEVSTKVNGRDARSAGVLSQRSRLAGVPPSVLGGEAVGAGLRGRVGLMRGGGRTWRRWAELIEWM